MSQAAPADAGKKKGKGKLLIVAGGLALLLAGAGGAFFFLRGGTAHGAAAAGAQGDEHETEPAHDPAIIALPTFTVNLADTGATRYLRTTLSLVINDTEKAATLSGGGDHKPAGEPARIAMARSAILELLTTKTADELMKPEGKTALKKENAERATHAFRFKVDDVLLAEFVVL